jgi:hypothetical protein
MRRLMEWTGIGVKSIFGCGHRYITSMYRELTYLPWWMHGKFGVKTFRIYPKRFPLSLPSFLPRVIAE